MSLPKYIAAPFLAASALSTTAHAGPAPQLEPVAEADAFSWITPTLNIRARYEFRDQDGLDAANAFTVRERVGLLIKPAAGLSFFAEGEFTQAIVDDYNVLQPSITPFNPGTAAIADPETNELNRIWLQLKGEKGFVKVGRQRLKFDNDQFIGNVGWRQNEQTFDAFTVHTTAFDDLKLTYSFANRAQRIFGSDAVGGAEEWEGNFHFLNAHYSGIDGWDLGGYIYSVNMDLGPARANGDTFGVSAAGKLGDVSVYGEYAFQATNSGTLDGVEDAHYLHLKASKKFGTQTFGVGFEYLSEDLYTPFSTVHAFNGFADVYIGGRLGLGTGHDGIADAYIFHNTKLPGGIVWKNWVHYIDAENGAGVDISGWEYDSVLVKKFRDDLTGIAKFYYFEDADSAAPSTTGFTVGLNFTY